MGLENLKPSAGRRKNRKRVGRGYGSGNGRSAGRGDNGQKSRSGYSAKRGFEGGQMPLHRRLPKRGFTNIFRIPRAEVNLSELTDRFEPGATVDLESLRVAKVIRRRVRLLRILGNGELDKPLVIVAHHFSASARSKIEAAGGRCEVVES